MLKPLEWVLLTSRWLLAPFYLGLVVGLVALMIKAGQHVIHIGETLLSATEPDVILSVLALIDLTLTASLVLIIILSGYENFITAFRTRADGALPLWLTTIDFAGVKLKLLASIVSISAIQLLRVFMSVGARSDRELFWSVAIHVAFVVSGLILAATDWLGNGSHAPAAAERAAESKP